MCIMVQVSARLLLAVRWRGLCRCSCDCLWHAELKVVDDARHFPEHAGRRERSGGVIILKWTMLHWSKTRIPNIATWKVMKCIESIAERSLCMVANVMLVK